MRFLIIICFVSAAFPGNTQSLIGTWQVVEEKTCFESQFKESETEKELRKDMGSTQNAVARIITFKKNGSGEEGIFSTGIRKGADMASFRYRVNGQEIQLLDKKSGMMTQQLIVDELSQTTLRIHLASKDCETKTFSRIK